jgi:hypothetical protein
MALKDIRKAFRAHLLGNAAVAALVVARVYPVRLPQGERGDSIAINEISGVGDHHMEGASGLSTSRIQVGCWSKTADGAHALHLAVKEAVDGYCGPMGSGANEVEVQGVFIDSWRDIDDTVADLRGKLADYRVVYSER